MLCFCFNSLRAEIEMTDEKLWDSIKMFLWCFGSQQSLKGTLRDIQDFQRIRARLVNCALFLSCPLLLPHVGPSQLSLHLTRLPIQLCSRCQHTAAERQGVLCYLDAAPLLAAHHHQKCPFCSVPGHCSSFLAWGEGVNFPQSTVEKEQGVAKKRNGAVREIKWFEHSRDPKSLPDYMTQFWPFPSPWCWVSWELAFGASQISKAEPVSCLVENIGIFPPSVGGNSSTPITLSKISQWTIQ